MQINSKILLIGGGGHSVAVADVIRAEDRFDILGFVDIDSRAPLAYLGYEYLGTDKQLDQIECSSALIAIGQIKSPSPRMKLFAAAQGMGFDLPAIISPHAYVAPNVELSAGSIVMHFAMINASTSIGSNVIINSATVVEHGVNIGNHCHIAPRATVLGDASIGNGCFIGAGAVIMQNVTIGNNAVIGAGVVVAKDVAAGSIVR